MSHARYQVRERRQRCRLFPTGVPLASCRKGLGWSHTGGTLWWGAESREKHARSPFMNPEGWMGPASPPETKVGHRWGACLLRWPTWASEGPAAAVDYSEGCGEVTPLGEEAKEKRFKLENGFSNNTRSAHYSSE